MSVMEFMFVPMILFMVIVAPIWIVLHYRSASHSSRSLNEDERESLEQMLVTVDRLTERIRTLESLLDAEHAGWRKDEADERMEGS
jgi:phage shock protein B